MNVFDFIAGGGEFTALRFKPGGGWLVRSVCSALEPVSSYAEGVSGMVSRLFVWTVTSSRHRSKLSMLEGKAGVEVGDNARRAVVGE